ncbi:hypothetical protein ACFDTO_08910 [Microbacteriaceae bacterium 4G12]
MAAIAALLIGGSIAGPASPAFADHTRQHTCDQAGGFYTAGATPGADRCVVTTSTSVTGPFGAPTTTFSEPVPDGTSPFFVDTPSVPVGAPTVEEETRDVGEPVVVETARVGTPVVESEERDAGEAVAVPVVVPGTPVVTTRTERGTPTSTQAPGYRNCKPVNSGKGDGKGDKGSPKVERCERTVVTTTTTPTTEVTTVTTPQERVTTTTQPRETVTTTTTPSTEVFTSTQQQENCVTTTQATQFTRTTTQNTTQTRSVSYRQRTITTTTTSTYRYMGNGQLALVVFPVADNPRVTTRTTEAEPLVTDFQQAGPPIVTVETRAGDSIVNTVCTPIAPEITVTEGETTFAEEVVVTPAPPQITETRETLDPVVTESRAPGEPVVTTSTRGTGKTCYNNPSTAEQRKNRC